VFIDQNVIYKASVAQAFFQIEAICTENINLTGIIISDSSISTAGLGPFMGIGIHMTNQDQSLTVILNDITMNGITLTNYAEPFGYYEMTVNYLISVKIEGLSNTRISHMNINSYLANCTNCGGITLFNDDIEINSLKTRGLVMSSPSTYALTVVTNSLILNDLDMQVLVDKRVHKLLDISQIPSFTSGMLQVNAKDLKFQTLAVSKPNFTENIIKIWGDDLNLFLSNSTFLLQSYELLKIDITGQFLIKFENITRTGKPTPLLQMTYWRESNFVRDNFFDFADNSTDGSVFVFRGPKLQTQMSNLYTQVGGLFSFYWRFN